jgi:CRISPR-associated endoribonuclease Cas6
LTTDGHTAARYLRPTEGDAFSEAVRKNLIAKYRVLHGHDPQDDRVRLTFSPGYLARDRHAGTKKITFGRIDLIGALAPLTLTAAPELLTLAYECGLGQGNSMGFGMLDLDTRPLARDAK